MSMIGTYDNNSDSGLIVDWRPAPSAGSDTTPAQAQTISLDTSENDIISMIKKHIWLIVAGIALIIIFK